MSLNFICAIALLIVSAALGYAATMSVGAAVYGLTGSKIPGVRQLGQTPEDRTRTINLALGVSRVLVLVSTGAGVCAGLLFARG